MKLPTAFALTGRVTPVLGFEPKVIGASFNQANVNKVVPEAIAGSQGVYIIRVDNIMATPVAAANVEQERMMRYQQAKQQTRFAALQALREAATIKDNRNKFY